MVKVVLNGCCGKMGKMITECCTKFKNVEIVAGIDRFPSDISYPVFSSPEELNIEYDVLLDFSRADALNSLLALTEKTRKPLVICSTGFSDEQLALFDEKSKTLPLFRSANMSLGIPLLYGNYDIEIIEKHHNQKVDSPSGTALLLADTIRDSLKDETKYVYGREGHAKREENEIGIHAIRGGSIVGDHDVIFAGSGEIIELTHKAISREVFAVGALKACEFMASITEPGLYNMDDVIGLND